MTETCHIAVMEKEVLEHLQAGTGGSFLDCTLGGGGHTRAILDANSTNQVVAIDRDKRAIERTGAALAAYSDRLQISHADFSGVPALLQGRRFKGVLADLGLSSDQLSESRGFSFDDASPLDMRMDESQELTASDLVNEMGEGELCQLLREGGAAKEARYAARAIVRARPIGSARDLAGILRTALKGRLPQRDIHPATVVFQALRIAVNNEFEQIKNLLDTLPQTVEEGGRAVLICFHSLEDELVTGRMRQWAGSEFSAQWPGSQGSRPLGRMLTRKAATASDEERELNPRARSARLRVFEFGLRH